MFGPNYATTNNTLPGIIIIVCVLSFGRWVLDRNDDVALENLRASDRSSTHHRFPLDDLDLSGRIDRSVYP